MTTLRYKSFETLLRLTGQGNTIGKALKRGNIPSASVPAKLRKRWTKTEFHGRDVFVCQPRLKDNDRVYIHKHGGAYAIGLIPLHFAMFTTLADMSGVTIILPDYPLPPSQNAIEIIDWAAAHYNSVVEELGPEKVKLGGDSAGGNLALALSQTIEISGPIILLSPWVDLEAGDMTEDGPNTECLLDPITLKAAGRKYAGEQGVKNPLISPIFADPETLSDVVIFTGEKDLLFGQIMRFADQMKRAGKLTKLATYGEFGHYWMFYPVPDRQSTLIELADILRR